MKRLCFIFVFMCLMVVVASAHPINQYKYLYLERQDDVPSDVEKRFLKEFSKLGFEIVDDDAYAKQGSDEKKLTITAKYKIRGTAICMLLLYLIDPEGNVIYDDIQIGDVGFMSAKNDRQSSITRLFRELEKLEYRFNDETVRESN